MTKVSTKIGDVFSVKIDDHKKYFQYIANDRTQLNSDVIRGFKKRYSIDVDPNSSEIIKDEVVFYAHCVTKLGVKMNLWNKIGNTLDIGKLDRILFRCTSDYGLKLGEEPVKISDKWYVWRINDLGFTTVGKLEGDYQKSFIGLVINPYGIIELLKGNKYPPIYPDYSLPERF